MPKLAALVTAYNAQSARRRDSEDRLATSERRMRQLTDNLPVLISDVDADESHLFLNGTFKTWLGVDPTAAISRTMAELIPPAIYALRRGLAYWFASANSFLGGKRAQDVLPQSPDRVLAAATDEMAEIAHG